MGWRRSLHSSPQRRKALRGRAQTSINISSTHGSRRKLSRCSTGSFLQIFVKGKPIAKGIPPSHDQRTTVVQYMPTISIHQVKRRELFAAYQEILPYAVSRGQEILPKETNGKRVEKGEGMVKRRTCMSQYSSVESPITLQSIITWDPCELL